MGRNPQSDYPVIDAVDTEFDNEVQAETDYLNSRVDGQDDLPVTPGHRSRNADNYQAFDDGDPSEFGGTDYEGEE